MLLTNMLISLQIYFYQICLDLMTYQSQNCFSLFKIWWLLKRCRGRNQQNYNNSSSAMHKIDCIRRKLEEKKRKSIFEGIRVNTNISFLSQTPKPLPTPHQLPTLHQLPTTLSVFPIISKSHTHEVSTNHSERSLTTDPFLAELSSSGRRTHGSIFVERSKMRSRKQRLAENVEELAAKTLNPSTRINWACSMHSQTATLKNAGSCVISTQTPSTVVILTEPHTPSGSANRALFRRTIPKRQSVAARQAYSPPEKGESPTRKFSISAWETFDEE